MKKNYKNRSINVLKYGLMAFILLTVNATFAQNFATRSGGAWSSVSIWNENGVAATRIPGAGDIVTINAGHNVTVNGYTAECLTLTTSAELFLNDPNSILIVYGDAVVQGFLRVLSTTGLVDIRGNLTVQGSSSAKFEINNGKLSVGQNLTIASDASTDNFYVRNGNTGTLIVGGNLDTYRCITFEGGATAIITGSYIVRSNGNGGNYGRIQIRNSNITTGSLILYTTNTTGSMVQDGGSITVNGGFELLGAGHIFEERDATITINNGYFVNNATFTAHANMPGTFRFTGINGTISGTSKSTFNVLVVNVDNVLTLSSTAPAPQIEIQNNGGINLVSGIFSLPGMQINTGDQRFTINATGGNFATTGVNGADGGFIYSRVANGNWFELIGGSPVTFYDLEFTGNNNVTISNSTQATVNGTLTVNNNSFNSSGFNPRPIYGPASTLFLNYAGNNTITGLWLDIPNPLDRHLGTPGHPFNVTMARNDVGNQTLPEGKSISGTLKLFSGYNSTVTANNNWFCGGLDIQTGIFQIQSSGNRIIVKGSYTKTGGTFTHNNGTIAFAATGTVTTNNASEFYNMELAQDANLSLGSNVSPLNGFILSGDATLNLGDGTDRRLTFGATPPVFTAATTLTITNWQGDYESAGTNGRLFFGSALTDAQLSQIKFDLSHAPFNIPFLVEAMQLASGEIVPMSVLANITLADNVAQIPGGIAYMGQSTLVYEFIAVSENAATTLTDFSFTTSGTAVMGTDITSYTVSYSTDGIVYNQLGDLITTGIDSTFTLTGSGFPNIAENDTGYFRITVAVSFSAVENRTIIIDSVAPIFSDSKTPYTITNLTMPGGTFIITDGFASITLSDIGTQLPGGIAYMGEYTDIYEFKVLVETAATQLTDFSFTTAGTAVMDTDITNFIVYYSTDGIVYDQLGDLITTGIGNTFTLTGSGFPYIAANGTGYFRITIEVPLTAVKNRTVGITSISPVFIDSRTPYITTNLTIPGGVFIIKAGCPTQIHDEINDITYNIIDLAGDCWFKENLRSTKYQDNTEIPFAKPYNSDTANIKDFGLLYDYASAFPAPATRSNRALCPRGWRIPTTSEWLTLNMYDQNALRNSAFWLTPNDNTNLTGFDLRGAGFYNGSKQYFEMLYGVTLFWASDAVLPDATTAPCVEGAYYCNTFRALQMKKIDGVSVRCVLDE